MWTGGVHIKLKLGIENRSSRGFPFRPALAALWSLSGGLDAWSSRGVGQDWNVVAFPDAEKYNGMGNDAHCGLRVDGNQSLLAQLVFHRALAIKVVMASFATAGRWRQEHLTQAFIRVNF